MRPTTKYHLSATKNYILRAITRDGAGAVLGAEWTGKDAEAMRAVRDGPRDYFPIGPCDHQNTSGKCLGHAP